MIISQFYADAITYSCRFSYSLFVKAAPRITGVLQYIFDEQIWTHINSSYHALYWEFAVPVRDNRLCVPNTWASFGIFANTILRKHCLGLNEAWHSGHGSLATMAKHNVALLKTQRGGTYCCSYQMGTIVNPSGGCCDIWYPIETHLKLKSREISFAHNLYNSCRNVLIFGTEHGSNTAVLSAKFQNDLMSDIGIMEGRDLTRFGFKVSFGRISYFNNPQRSVLRPEYSGISGSITWIPLAWPIASPGHQQPWQWQCKILEFY